MNNEQELNVGDMVYQKNHFSGYLKRSKVQRVTKTQAVLKDGTRIKRKGLGYFYEIGTGTSFRSYHWMPETESIKINYIRQQKLLKAKKAYEEATAEDKNWTFEKLQAVAEFISNYDKSN